eukprot:180457-Pelagomonas_calceolata.AAC.1
MHGCLAARLLGRWLAVQPLTSKAEQAHLLFEVSIKRVHTAGGYLSVKANKSDNSLLAHFATKLGHPGFWLTYAGSI